MLPLPPLPSHSLLHPSFWPRHASKEYLGEAAGHRNSCNPQIKQLFRFRWSEIPFFHARGHSAQLTIAIFTPTNTRRAACQRGKPQLTSTQPGRPLPRRKHHPRTQAPRTPFLRHFTADHFHTSTELFYHYDIMQGLMFLIYVFIHLFIQWTC